MGRYCVFSHEELICKLAACPDDLQVIGGMAYRVDLRKVTHDAMSSELLLFGKNVNLISVAVICLLCL
jgi:hypothetical protein